MLAQPFAIQLVTDNQLHDVADLVHDSRTFALRQVSLMFTCTVLAVPSCLLSMCLILPQPCCQCLLVVASAVGAICLSLTCLRGDSVVH